MGALRNFNGLVSWRNAKNSLQSVNVTMPAPTLLPHHHGDRPVSPGVPALDPAEPRLLAITNFLSSIDDLAGPAVAVSPEQ